MVSTTFVKDAQLELQRPSAQSAEAADTKSVKISIDRQGAVYLGEEAIRLWMLQSRVREQLRASSQSKCLGHRRSFNTYGVAHRRGGPVQNGWCQRCRCNHR